MTWGEGSAALSIVTVIVIGGGMYNSLSEAKAKHEITLTAHSEQIQQLRLEMAEGTGQRALEIQVRELAWEVKELKEQIQELRKKK
jgi:hypothetical protein